MKFSRSRKNKFRPPYQPKVIIDNEPGSVTLEEGINYDDDDELIRRLGSDNATVCVFRSVDELDDEVVVRFQTLKTLSDALFLSSCTIREGIGDLG